MRKLLSSIALVALATAAVQADPGGNKGQGGGKDRDSGAQVGKSFGGGERDDGEKDRGDKGAPRADRGMDERDAQVKRGRDDSDDQTREQARRDERGFEDRGDKRGKSNADNDNRDDNWDGKGSRFSWRDYDRHGLVNGCPPGLAKKQNGCMPPGLAKQDDLRRYDARWFGLRGLSDVSGYRYIDGNLVRLAPDGGVIGYYPLLGGALAVGNPWPSGWQPTPLSPYYANYYGLGNDYRYFDGAIYRVDPQTTAIQSIAALLTGDTFTVGQRMPQGYSAYNVPYDYRDQYADSPEANYRYNDGYVYKSDPKTQLIIAAIQLLS